MLSINKLMLPVLVINLFDANTNVTTDVGLSNEMKTFYSDYLIRLAGPLLVHDQFGQKQPIPKNGGKIIEFRKYDNLPKALTALTEGVTPDGQKLSMSVITATVAQYGGYVTLSDILLLTAVDNNLMEATRLIADQAGRTLDTITREVLNGGTNVLYGEGSKTSRSALVGGELSANDYLTVDCVRKAVRFLKVMNARRINGDFVGIIHPDAAYDLMSDSKWVNVKTYSDPSGIYEGEIGKIEGVRFVETSEAKVFHAEDLTLDDTANSSAGHRTLTYKSVSTKTITIGEKLSSAQATALVGRKIILKGVVYNITAAAAGAANSATITVAETITGSPSANDVIYPEGGGAKGVDVYSTLILGADAYGVTEVTGGGLQHIVKQLGSAGSADPLDQRATVGWKATKVAERLVESYMVRIETASTFNVGAN